MSDLNKVVVNNMEKRQRDNLPKVHGRDRSFVNIRASLASLSAIHLILSLDSVVRYTIDYIII
jgi:hypothetical protein